MPTLPDPDTLWRRLLDEVQTKRGKAVLLSAATVALFIISPDEVVRAVVSSAVLVATARLLGPPD